MDITDVQNALANEALRGESRQKIAKLVGTMNATSSVIQQLNSVNSDSAIALAAEQAKLAALESGAGPGVTDDFGPKSVITQLIELEREAAKSAAIDYVKANPDCAEADAAKAWNDAALSSHTDFPMVIQDGTVMLALYRANMAKAGVIPDDAWESQRQWVIVTDKATIESM